MCLVLYRVGWGGVAVNLALEKEERVTMGGMGEIKCKAGEIIGVVEDVPTIDSLWEKYGACGG